MPLFEVFDYLVDVLEERAASVDRGQRDAAVILIDMYHLVVERASQAELPDVEIAARTQFKFIGRTGELAELTSWLASPLGSSPPLMILHGMGGIGKTAILRRLQELADPRTRELIAANPGQSSVNVPRFDVVLSARERTGSELLTAICAAAGLESLPSETDAEREMRLRDGLRGRHRPMLVAIDGLDEAYDPERAMDILVELYRADNDLPLRILVSTRQQPPFAPGIVSAIEVSAGTRQELLAFARDRLAAARGSAAAELTDQTAQLTADFANGSFLAASLIASAIAHGSVPSDPAGLAQKLHNSQPRRSDAAIRVALEGLLDSLGDRKPEALVLLAALARGPAEGMTAEELLDAASRLGHRPYTKADLDWLSQSGLIGRPRDDGTYALHHLVRTFVLDYEDHGNGISPPQSPGE